PDYKFENGDHAGEISANLVLDAYNLLGDYSKVNEWARKFYAEPRLATGKFREELAKLIEQSAFKLVNKYEANKDFVKAAEAYEGFVKEFPRSEIADKALHNASSDYFQAKLIDKASALCKQIIREYPKSEFVPACVFNNASYLEAVAEFEDAARFYEQYATGYERGLSGKGKSKETHTAKKGKKGKESPEDHGGQIWDEAKAQIALFNAGVFRDALGQYKRALNDREKFLELWPDAQDFEKVFLSIADLEEKNGSYGKAQKQLEEYEKKYLKDSNKVLTAEGRIADIYEKKEHRAKEAQRIFERIMKYYDSLPQRTKAKLDDTSLEAVGRAHYALSEDDWKKYNAIQLRWTKLTGLGELKSTIKEKAKGLEAVQKRYTSTVTFKAGGPAICALYRIGSAYDHFSDSLVKIKMPKGVPPELEDEIRQQFQAQAEAPKAKAAEAFAAAVQKSRELDIFNDCSDKALAELRDTYAPDKFPQMQDDKLPVKLNVPITTPATGGDLVIDVKPWLSPAQLLENRARASKAKQGSGNDGEAKTAEAEKPDKDAEVDPAPGPDPIGTPAPDPAPQPSERKAQAPTKGEGNPKKKTEEPEEPL
ncbi:MAG TPA: hypothetical protein VH208_11715, partial [Myxococcaceae bacterium]|nr:hypothetical protein [Myxococcaceae bacterium]